MGGAERTEKVAAEEPLELRLCLPDGPLTLAVLMRTPGDDAALLRGWLVSEGVLPETFDLLPDEENPNLWYLHTPESEKVAGAARLAVSSSACGVCGTGSIERLSLRVGAPSWTAGLLAPELIYALPDRLLQGQKAFRDTGGTHGAALFSAAGDLLSAAEDVGRHNAVDKVVGTLFGSLPLSNHILCVSSRAGFEIVQKAISAGIAVVVSVGAPTSLAIDTAQVFGVTLCAFTREGRTTVYSGMERLGGRAKDGVADRNGDRAHP
ncbi:MAG: formate dehydrogenase accessory sulfurtransferase FdhD [Deinococcus sp.]|uniref:formate dehydrogenase accessory sulfurtransferase FdhD n=1 Tax=Deinococcus sp. TaxID=47478 RepID=UPI0026DD6F25|nr:formate dehydrogenase accessory sulfurtransferase FdhD [Deinococcus sp.]MDO4245764.1 formate dehydrogenase accessory sulfurtransferase FdhD [Deinococcus sp.]